MTNETKIEELLQKNLNATRVGNAIRLGQALGLDVTEPLARQKVLRHLSSVESEFAGTDNG